MKKFFTLLAMCFALTVNAQNKHVVFYEDFNGNSLPEGWKAYDRDGDGYSWVMAKKENPMNDANPEDYPYGKTGDCLASLSYDRVTHKELTPDNWVVTPSIHVGKDAYLNYQVGRSYNFPQEHYGVYVMKAPDAFDKAELLWEETMDYGTSWVTWNERELSLEDYEGEDIYIGFRHFDSTNKLVLLLDEVKVTAGMEYPLYVGGVQVNDGNLNDVLGDGTASYNKDTKTLKLDGVTINVNNDGCFAISNGNYNWSTGEVELGITGLTIELCGDNVINTKGNETYTLVSYGVLKFTGTGTLKATSTANGIWSQGSLEIEGPTLDISAYNGSLVTEGFLAALSGRLKARSESTGAVAAAKGLVQRDMYILIPDHGYLDKDKGMIVDDKGEIAYEVEMGKLTETGIQGIEKEYDDEHSYFNIDGRRFDKLPVQRGIYIVDRKKVFIK
jgi:hypothetical protein